MMRGFPRRVMTVAVWPPGCRIKYVVMVFMVRVL
jgi:hypothetical protein